MGVDGAVGHVVEYAGPAIEALSMEGRMTICNMTIEGGGRAGMIAPDDDDVRLGPAAAPRRRTGADWDALVERWRGAAHRRRARRSTARSPSTSTRSARWSPGARTPAWSSASPAASRSPQGDGDRRALEYMGLEAGTPIEEIKLDRVFIGSCTNSRIGDLRAAAEMIKGRQVADSVYAMVVPGSVQVKAQAEAEGLDEIFSEAGFDWRGAGCSMCLGMNPDILQPGRALRLDLEPQLRGPPGPGRPHPPRQPADGRRGGDRGPLRRHPRLELNPWTP